MHTTPVDGSFHYVLYLCGAKKTALHLSFYSHQQKYFLFGCVAQRKRSYIHCSILINRNTSYLGLMVGTFMGLRVPRFAISLYAYLVSDNVNNVQLGIPYCYLGIGSVIS